MSTERSAWAPSFDEDEIPQIGGERRNIADPTGKAGQIVAVMEQRLMLGYYRPGEMLSFNLLADEFKISRQPVSVAISHLRASGYVEVIPHIGCRVVEPRPAEVRDFFVVLARIDSAVAAMAAERYEGDEGEVLLAIDPPELFGALKTIQQRKAYIGYLGRFHDQIWKMARAPLLEAKFSGLRGLSNFYLWQGAPSLAPQAAKTLIAERNKVARAIFARDAKAAARIMEKHIAGKPRLIGLP